MHHDAAKMQLEAAKLQHSAAGARSAQPLPEVQPKDAFKDIPYDPPSKPRESSKYLNSIPPLSKHNYHDTLQSSKLGAPPAAVEAKWNADAKQYNYNQAAEGASTAVQSGPPHKEHDVRVVKS